MSNNKLVAIWKQIENIYNKIIPYKYGVYPANGGSPVIRENNLKEFLDTEQQGTVIPTVETFVKNRVGTCWEAAIYFAATLPSILGNENYRLVYLEGEMSGEFVTHTFSLINVGDYWYKIDSEAMGRRNKFNKAKLLEYPSIENFEKSMNKWDGNTWKRYSLDTPYTEIINKLGKLSGDECLAIFQFSTLIDIGSK